MPNTTRRQARESALQALYLMDQCNQGVADLHADVWAEIPLTGKSKEFATHLAQGVMQHQEQLDAVIVKYTENWAMDRMAVIDRCVLRLASFELLHDLETPVNVIINEALEIAKKFSTADSSKFVNGILDKVKLERPSLKE